MSSQPNAGRQPRSPCYTELFPGCSPAQMPVFHVTLINDGLLSKGSFLVSYLKVQALFTPVNSPLSGVIIFWLCFSNRVSLSDGSDSDSSSASSPLHQEPAPPLLKTNNNQVKSGFVNAVLGS